MGNTDDIERHREQWRYYARLTNAMKVEIFDWQDVMLITQDKDNKLWVVITFKWEAQQI